MVHETNIDSIQALDKQIEEGKGDLIRLKRARNSLLNISTRLPLEILGHIFARSLIWRHGGFLSSYNKKRGLLMPCPLLTPPITLLHIAMILPHVRSDEPPALRGQEQTLGSMYVGHFRGISRH